MIGFRNELENNILSFWINRMIDNENGGFYGCIDGNNILYPQANKGAVLNTRILWTFSAAYRITRNKEYQQIANRAFDYITTYFIDKEHGGIYWELDYKGIPVNTKKQTYAQGFALYAFSEYYRITQNEEVLNLAKKIFNLIEKTKDDKHGGYFEAFSREWNVIDDMRLSEKDANEAKTMNTHLHILEAFTNLYRVWSNGALLDTQKNLIDIFIEKILDKETNHLNLFFDEKWNRKSTAVSFGHDIEASWLLFEAAEALKDTQLLKKIKTLSLKITDATLKGLQEDGSLIYEKEEEHIDLERHWWVQAEAVVGYMYAFENSGEQGYKEKAENVWKYIQNNIVDKENGEWFWSRKKDGLSSSKEDKAGFWKCPYHNGRMCLEMIEHFGFD